MSMEAVAESIPPGYKQTEVGVIPEDWDISPLDSFLSFISYGFTNPMPSSDSGVYMVTAKDINQGKIQFDTARCTTEEAYRTLLTDKSRPKPGDLLLTKDGALGRLALVDDRRICINQSVAVLRLNSKAEAKFLKVLLEAPQYQSRMLEDAGGSTIKHIYITIVNLMPIAVPPTLAEQEAIATALSDTDALIEFLEQLIAKKRQIKQGAMQELLTGKRRLPGFSGEWGMITIKSIGEVRGRVGWKGYTKKDLVDSGPYAIGAKHIDESNRLDLSDPTFLSYEKYIESPEIMVQTDDILIVQRGTIGKLVLVDRKIGEATINPSMVILRLLREVSCKFVFYFLTSKEGQTQITFDTSSTGVPMITQKQIENFHIILPSTLEEQTAIVAILSDMDSEITTLEEKLVKTRQIKQGMMQELLTGRIRLV